MTNVPRPTPRLDAVIKIGGSLLDWPELPGQLETLVKQVKVRKNAMAIVVGGGRIVDEIRRIHCIHDISQETAHELAIRAMETTSHIFKAVMPPDTFSVVSNWNELNHSHQSGLIPIIVPWQILEEEAQIRPNHSLPRSWETTSDSIAARLARILHARILILAKSVLPTPGSSLKEAAENGIVDQVMLQEADGLQVGIVNLRDDPEALQWLGPLETSQEPEAKVVSPGLTGAGGSSRQSPASASSESLRSSSLDKR